MAPTVRRSPWRGSRRPKASCRTKPTSGASRMTRAAVSIASAPQARDLVDVDAVARVEHGEDDREGHGRLGRGDGEHEEGEHLAAHAARPEAVERDEVH